MFCHYLEDRTLQTVGLTLVDTISEEALRNEVMDQHSVSAYAIWMQK